MGFGPTANSKTLLPQKAWSFIEVGQMSVGLPARNPSAVVPAPPWWTTAAILGNSHSCGAESITHTSSGTFEGSWPPPVVSTLRCLLYFRAANVALMTFSEVHVPRLPKPT